MLSVKTISEMRNSEKASTPSTICFKESEKILNILCCTILMDMKADLTFARFAEYWQLTQHLVQQLNEHFLWREE